MQTIIVTVNQQGEKTALQIGSKVIATITKDSFNKGCYSASFGAFGCCNNSRYPDALQFITDCIENHFAELGLNVVFEKEQTDAESLIIKDFAKYGGSFDYPTVFDELGGFKLGEVVYDQCGEIGVILAFYEGYEARLDSNGVTGVDNLKKCPKEIAEREVKSWV